MNGGYSGETLTYTHTPANTAFWNNLSITSNGDESTWSSAYTYTIKPSFQAAAENMIRSSVQSGDLICAVYPPPNISDGYIVDPNVFTNANDNDYAIRYYYWLSSGNDSVNDCGGANNIQYQCNSSGSDTTPRYTNEFSNNSSGTNPNRYVFWQEIVDLEKGNQIDSIDFDNNTVIFCFNF
jgi:hypothetical protein